MRNREQAFYTTDTTEGMAQIFKTELEKYRKEINAELEAAFIRRLKIGARQMNEAVPVSNRKGRGRHLKGSFSADVRENIKDFHKTLVIKTTGVGNKANWVEYGHYIYGRDGRRLAVRGKQDGKTRALNKLQTIKDRIDTNVKRDADNILKKY